jgi:hypothetical protein
LRIIAGPEVPEINLRIMPVPAPKANTAWQKAERRAARRSLIQYATPPVNIIGGYRFPGAPAFVLHPARAALTAPAIPIGDGLRVPDFLKRTDQAAGAVMNHGAVNTPATPPQFDRRCPRMQFMRRGNCCTSHRAGRPSWCLSDGDRSLPRWRPFSSITRSSFRPAARCFQTCRARRGGTFND